MLIGLYPLKAKPLDVGLESPEKGEDEPEEHHLDKYSSMEALLQFCKSPRFWFILILQAADGPFISIMGDWLTYWVKEQYQLSEVYATMATSILTIFRCLGVIIGGFLCDYLSYGSQIFFFTITCIISTAFFGIIVFWPNIPIIASMCFIGAYSFFISPTYYLAGQFFFVTFGGAKHCGFLDSLKDAISCASSMLFSFISGFIIENNWVYLFHTNSILGLLSTVFVFCFCVLEWWHREN